MYHNNLFPAAVHFDENIWFFRFFDKFLNKNIAHFKVQWHFSPWNVYKFKTKKKINDTVIPLLYECNNDYKL